MLIVSAFFDYGNELEENQNEAGCVGNSEETNLNIVSKNFLLYRSSDIGCCNDFAYMLASFLNHLKIDNQLITIPGHKANMIYLDDSTLYIDANTNLIVDNFLKQQDKIFFIYPHPNVSQQSHRFSMLNFQNNLIENLSYHEHFIYNYIKLNPSDTIDQQFLN